MAPNVTFRSYLPSDRNTCLDLFDANCPEYFAPDERPDYASFLDANPDGYQLCCSKGRVVGAFGLTEVSTRVRSLNWILLSPLSQGMGIGTTIMDRIVSQARRSAVIVVRIAASHKSAPFFARFGATEVARTDDGWGPGLHRVDMELTVSRHPG